MSTFERVFVAANRWALILILAAMSLIVFANVVLRYLTNDSLVWAEEVSRYLMIWMTLLGAGLVLRFGGHVAIDNLHFAVGAGAARLLRLCICVLMIAFFCFMAWLSIGYMQIMRFQTTPATGIPFSYVYAAIPAGLMLLVVHMLLIMRGYVGEYRFAESGEIDPETAASI